MSEAKHTPGPWRTQGWVPTWAYIPIKDARHNLVASLYPDTGHGYSREEVEANANLIVRVCNLVMAGKALTDAHSAKVVAEGNIPADPDWGLTENEIACARMLNALMAERDELLTAVTQCQKILAMLIDPANKGSGITNIAAWTFCVAAEEKARAAIAKATVSA